TPAAGGQNETRDPASAALDVLAQAFGVVTERGAPGSGVRQRTWLDTFDWRLNRAGLVLEYQRAKRAGRLLLSRDGAPLAEQPVTGWQPRRPHLAEDLPAGPVRDQILKLVSPRALLPVARAVGTVSVTRLLNADGKTVARLIVDRSTAWHADANPSSVELPPRLAIAEVRGYPAQARRAGRLLAGVPGMSTASQSVFAAALHALGSHPGDYSGGVDAEISAQMPASVAVATVLLRLLDTLELNLDGVLRDIDTEFLHDLRVSVRRTRSAIKLLGGVLPDGLAGPYAAEFKWLGDLTTPTRDLDVHLLGFGPMAEHLVAASQADLEPFRAYLIRRRAREFRRLAAGLRSARFKAITDHWRKALVEVRDAGGPRTRRREPTAAELAISTTRRAFRKIVARGGAITQDSPPESLHDLRKRAKELRYLLEFFAPLHDPVLYKKVVGDLKQLQDCLGEFQDSQVQREEIHALADAMLAERAAPAATLLAMGEIAANLAISQAEAREDFSLRFARFAGPAGQQRMRALLDEPDEAGE
ncbi:MAG TPA: CHAD domain-containing protein, partial [Streptosporangiaceae bacterium]|nr:CHAD domain-containing protein [Streptosporangiaceae bacterium]